ncbi:N-acetylmuramoyl-L-alanine amidase [uncultured Tenacibaculum sp.]|uniref:N-acetylmuramoyl-L-alanine amidase family protein n=1 Tax=uncultured Tenacibaculum sp. TaxID=174713 RepID=UPI0026109F55|nr:N-acetylmuramoyl-L-alanine amidase [uncultured Tenacibaculum sp.]
MKILKFTKNNIKNLTFIFFIGITFFTCVTSVNAQKKYVVVLDAGHGGKDPGNLGNGYREKNIALRVALDVGKELLTSRDIKVVFTRKKDVFVELHNRAKIANNKKADLFVSIHCDSYSKDRAHGAGTFVLGLRGNSGNLEIAKRENASILYEDNYEQNYDYNPNSPESLIGLSVLQEKNLDNSLAIAGHIQSNFSNLKRFDRKVKQDNFLVLRETIMPSVLVELGFLTNKAEGRFLNTRRGQIKMAKAIADAIKKYVNQLKINTVGGSLPVIVEKTKKEIVAKKKPAPKELVTKKIVTPKKKVKKDKKKTQNIVVKKQKINKSLIEFKVQIAASKRSLTKNNFNLKGLKNVKSLFIDGYYKYYYGNTVVFQEIKKFLSEARKAGHKDAFVVAFKGGKKISIKEALKTK